MFPAQIPVFYRQKYGTAGLLGVAAICVTAYLGEVVNVRETFVHRVAGVSLARLFAQILKSCEVSAVTITWG